MNSRWVGKSNVEGKVGVQDWERPRERERQIRGAIRGLLTSFRPAGIMMTHSLSSLLGTWDEGAEKPEMDLIVLSVYQG